MIFINAIIIFQGSQLQMFPRVRVPQEISDQLLHEMETSILEALVEEENNERHLPDIFLICSLLSNLVYGSFFTRFVTLWSSFTFGTDVMVYMFAKCKIEVEKLIIFIFVVLLLLPYSCM